MVIAFRAVLLVRCWWKPPYRRWIKVKRRPDPRQWYWPPACYQASRRVIEISRPEACLWTAGSFHAGATLGMAVWSRSEAVYTPLPSAYPPPQQQENYPLEDPLEQAAAYHRTSGCRRAAEQCLGAERRRRAYRRLHSATAHLAPHQAVYAEGRFRVSTGSPIGCLVKLPLRSVPGSIS